MTAIPVIVTFLGGVCLGSAVAFVVVFDHFNKKK